MNERTKQLWEEAAKTTQGDSWEEQTKFMERFAELIVQECAQHALDFNTNIQSLPDKVMRANLYRVLDYIKDRMELNNE